MNDVLREVDWNSSLGLPVANAANKLLEEVIAKKTQERNRVLASLAENRAKTQALRDHIKNVRDELTATQHLHNARKNEHKTEEHLRQIAEREAGRLMQENQNLELQLGKLKEKRNAHENEIFLANQQFDSMKSQMKWDHQALEAWLEESAQKDEDALTLKKYAKEDEIKIKELTLKIEKLVEQYHRQKRAVDDETMETMTVQVELDKTAEEFRRTHKERQELIKQWELIIDQMQKRDFQIDSSAQQLMKMNIDLSAGKDELDAKKKFYDDQKNMNLKLQADIGGLDQAISDLSIKLTREEQNRLQFQDELGGLKRTVERTSRDVEKARSDLANLKRQIGEKGQLIAYLHETNKELVKNLKSTLDSTLSAEENAKRMESFFLHAKQEEFEINERMKKLSKANFTATQHYQELKREEKNLEALINGCEATLKNLENRINSLDHESLKQAETIYTQDFKIQTLERRENRLKGEKNNDEQVELERRIAELKKVKEEKKEQYDTLMIQYKRVEDETRKSKREIEEMSKERGYIDTKIAELTLHIDTAQRLLEKIKVEKEDLMVNENLKKLELKKLRENLDLKADQVLDLNKRRQQLELAMKERRDDINTHQSLLKAQLRGLTDELQTLSSELKSRIAKVEKLKKRYDIIMISMAPPEGSTAEENSQAYYVIKAAQEKEELQREGDELDAKIKKAEKELKALENTLDVVNSKNDAYKQNFSKAGDNSDAVIHKQELEQQLRSLSDTYKHKRKQLKQLDEDLRNMEEAYSSMSNDERAYEELIAEKLNKVIQTEKDLEQLAQKIERAANQLVNYSRELRRQRNTQEPTAEEKDFHVRDLLDFNKAKTRELAELAAKYPELKQTLSVLFAQANLEVPSASSASGSVSGGSSRSSRDSTRRNSASSSAINSPGNSERASSRNGARAVNIGFDLPPTGRSGSNAGTPKSSQSSKR